MELNGIEWEGKKQSAKYIVYNESSHNFKLKNAKTDTGKPVMRRQTFKSIDKGNKGEIWIKTMNTNFLVNKNQF